MWKIRAVLLAAVALALAARAAGQDVLPKASESELIATLESQSPLEDKANACRQLAVVGTRRAVPRLAALLADEKLAHMARYALEPIPDPAVDEALRAALGQLKGRRLVGVICSVGVRRDKEALPQLVRLLEDNDPEVAQAAARALGRLGTAEAAKALQHALVALPEANRPAVCEGLFRGAAALAEQGRRDEALAIYDRLRSLAGPHQVRAGALVAAIVARQKDGLPLLAEHLRSPEGALFAAALRAAEGLPGPEVTSILIGALGDLPDDRQIPVIQALAWRRDPAALGALAARAEASATPVRLAAMHALAELGRAEALPALLASLAGADPAVAQTAKDCLAGLPGAKVDAAVLAMFAERDGARRLTALELMGRRRTTAAIPVLLKAASQDDPQIRAAVLRRLGELAGPAELPVLFGMLLRAKEAQDLDAVERAIGDVVARLDHPESNADEIAVLLAQAAPEPKGALLRILGVIGGAETLKAVRAAVGDPNREVQTAAVRALGAWKTADAVPELLAIARTDANPSHKMLALRAYLSWAGRADLPAGERLEICRQAGQLAGRIEEKRLLLSVLGSMDSPEALEMIAPYLAQTDAKDEAAAAVISLAERLLKRPDAAAFAGRLVEPLQNVTQASVAPRMAERAKVLHRQAQGRARKQ